MNPDNNLVRVHLRQVMLIGWGEAAQYSHTLVGERQPLADEQHGKENFVAINVTDFVRGGVSRNLERPALHLLAASNILSVEKVRADSQLTRCRPHGRPSCGYCDDPCITGDAGYQHTLVCTGTPESLWGRNPWQTRRVHHLEVANATRIIQLRDDGTYDIVKDTADKNAAFANAIALGRPYPPLPSRPTLRLKNEVILLFGEGGR